MTRSLRALLALLPLPACATAYVPGTLRVRDDTYDVRRVGCLDVAVRPMRDPVIAFTFANCCRYPVGVDFRNLTVRAWTSDGREYHPLISDPRHELHEAVIDGHAEADVAVDFPVPESTPTFCIDVARLNVDQPAPHPEAMCFRTSGYGRPAAVSESEAHPLPTASAEEARLEAQALVRAVEERQ